MQFFKFKNFNSDNQYNRYFVTIKDNTYNFTVRWSDYCDCGFLSIYDYNNNPIVMGKALTNGLIIRNKNLPYIFYFMQINDETYEPTIDNIASEFAIFYDDEAETV